MATRSNRTASPAEGRPVPHPFAWDWAIDIGRQQLAVATEGACAFFGGLQSMRRIQEQAAREVTEHQALFTQQLRKPCSPIEVMALQGELLRFQLDAATRYWQQLAGAAMETGTEMMACGAHMVDAEDVLAATSPRILHS